METILSTIAQVFVGPLVGTISDHYLPAILEKIGIRWDVTEEIEKLSKILFKIKAVLKDAEDKQTTSEQIDSWLRNLKDVAYEVEDILDVCATEALLEPESTGIINEAAMVARIKKVIDKFDKIINEQRSKFDLINLSSTTRVVNYRVDDGRQTSSFPPELVFGRDEEKERIIVNLMVNNINAGNLSIYAIVGIGGLGKTTLAQMVYQDNKVTSCFEIKRWVCVSENFEVKSIIGDIIKSGSVNNSQPLDQLQERLQNILRGKRFLLVLDDVWNEDEAEWETLKSSLLCGAEGSSIIVTTRSDKIASLMAGSSRSDKIASLMAGSSHDQVFHPKMLSEEDCFSLFKQRAFAEGEGEHHPKLESIGKKIVKMCGGVPLAAKALGGLLRFQRQETEWSSVEKSKLWDLPQNKKDSIMPALWLSYKHLPQHLRQCFAFCSLFPKDYKINKEEMIRLWMAHGFLQPNLNMELEDIGNGVFNDLVWRGFFQEVSIEDLDNTVCKMHDLVHDLACSITRDECFLVVTDADKELVVDRLKTTRHLTIDHYILVSPNFSLPKIKSFLRTFLQLENYMSYTGYVPPPLDLSNFIHLRVLDLHSTAFVDTMLESIARLKLLRYLDLSGTLIAILSDEVFGNLINLQTLKLRNCPYLEMLPGNMRKLTNLRQLDMWMSTDKLVGMPVGMGQLKCLNKLSDFIVSEDCGVGELRELNHLRGTLEITCLSKVKDVRDAENAKLSRKENIRVLRLNWLKTYVEDVPAESQTNSMNVKLIADALQPPPNIESLGFYNYVGSDFPSWMNSLCSLVKLFLKYSSKCKHLPTLGLLPHLKNLYLEDIPVECISNEFYCDEEEGSNMMKAGDLILFPALEELELLHMPSLEEWKGWSSSSRMKEGGETQVSVFPVLKMLTIYECPNLSTIPQLPMSLEYLAIEHCDGLKSLNKCLQLLTNLHSLRISYCRELELLPDDFQNLVSLRDLDIKANLPKEILLITPKYLKIEDCYSLKSLNDCLQTRGNIADLPLPMSMEHLKIRNCPALEFLPDDFQSLVSLRVLDLEALPKLAVVPILPGSTLTWISFYTCIGLTNLPECIKNQKSLQTFVLYECKNLKSLPEGILQNSLETLRIVKCDGLKSLNNCLQLLTNLHELAIGDCGELELLPDDFQNLVSLQSLELGDLPKLTVVPELRGSTLTFISFSACAGLTNLPEWITNQKSLQTLELDACKNLKSLPEGILQNSLGSLTSKECYGLKSLNNSLQLLTNLRSLAIRDCRELELFPDDFRSLVSLESLVLGDLPKLAAVPELLESTLEIISLSTCAGLTNLPVWITNQRSLQRLVLNECKNLKSLPEGLQHLTALRSLRITDCHPELHRRCEKNTGEDWHKIAHIPYLQSELH